MVRLAIRQPGPLGVCTHPVGLFARVGTTVAPASGPQHPMGGYLRKICKGCQGGAFATIPTRIKKAHRRSTPALVARSAPRGCCPCVPRRAWCGRPGTPPRLSMLPTWYHVRYARSIFCKSLSPFLASHCAPAPTEGVRVTGFRGRGLGGLRPFATRSALLLQSHAYEVCFKSSFPPYWAPSSGAGRQRWHRPHACRLHHLKLKSTHTLKGIEKV